MGGVGTVMELNREEWKNDGLRLRRSMQSYKLFSSFLFPSRIIPYQTVVFWITLKGKL